MSLLITGEVERITERQAGSPGNQWTEYQAEIKDWGATRYVTLQGDLLVKDSQGNATGYTGIAPGDKVAIEVAVKPYARKGNANDLGHSLTGFRRSPEVEKGLFGSPVRAAAAS